MYTKTGVLSLLCVALGLIPTGIYAQSTEDTVRSYFASSSVMADIARCESRFTQFNSDGSVLHGGYGHSMIGVFQISESVHADFAKSLGMDIYTLDGNLAYAKYLYDREGTQPWISSFPCWGPIREPAASNGAGIDSEVPTAGNLSMNLSLGMVDQQVLLLQQTLNAKGYVIAPDGPGSPGNETNKFGALTRVAVRKFQCAQMQICDGDEYTTGYGFVGSKTRAALLNASPREVSDEHSASQNVVVVAGNYTTEQREQIAALQAQIAQLTKVLEQLIAQRGS